MDSVGNTGSSSFTVTVRDTTAPAITIPTAPVVEATGPSGAIYTYSATAADLVAPASPQVSCSPASGSSFPLGATLVTCSAADSAGNNETKSFTVTVQDTTAPALTLPADVALEATGPEGAAYTFTASAADLVGPANPPATCTHLSGSTFPLGVTTVTCSAADTAGNTGSRSFTVTVQDTTPPVVHVPENASIRWVEPSGPTYTFTATATDLASPFPPAVTCAPPSGSAFPLGATTVTCTATDAYGNTGSATFTVTVLTLMYYYLPIVY